ncbi:MAG: hypothetical protein QGG46_00710 [Gammaproteobacteria bacterium]|jgi:hypothetical protein|nr:hypothetical protein [Gammaproteobacteria bacterium]
MVVRDVVLNAKNIVDADYQREKYGDVAVDLPVERFADVVLKIAKDFRQQSTRLRLGFLYAPDECIKTPVVRTASGRLGPVPGLYQGRVCIQTLILPSAISSSVMPMQNATKSPTAKKKLKSMPASCS